MEYYSLRTDHFRDMLDDLFNELNKQQIELSEDIATSKTVGPGIPFTQKGYNKQFNLLIREEGAINQILENLKLTKPTLDNIINKTEELLKSMNEAKIVMNHGRLRTGLQGLLKEKINREQPDIAKKLEGPIGDFLRSKEYVDAPYVEKGGKSRTRRNKNPKRSNKKSKKHY